MADKQVTVPVPEARVAEFYAWFASFLSSEPGHGPGRGRGRGRDHGPGPHGPRDHEEHTSEVWGQADGDRAAWLYARLAPTARELFDLLAAAPGERFAGNEVAARLRVDKGAHGVAGILAWPGRYSRRLGRALPIATEGRADGGTDYYMTTEVAALFALVAAPESPATARDPGAGESAPEDPRLTRDWSARGPESRE
ncbi:MAG TPA: DUF6416 domain-containing protein [Solirubrobacteraceae bacterium]|jgi:hypothetical protein|nr:DUF6416 domain-containing protein [Solirubrobacteraceae bacterium]